MSQYSHLAVAVCGQIASHCIISYAQYTPLTPTRLNCRAELRRRYERSTHPSAIVTQFTRPCAVELLRLVTSDDIMTSLLKKLSISTEIHVVKPQCSVSKLSTESGNGSRRELVADCVHTADATQLDSCVASASAVCSLLGIMWLANSAMICE